MTCEGTVKHKCDLAVFCTHLFMLILMFAQIDKDLGQGGNNVYLYPKIILSEMR